MVRGEGLVTSLEDIGSIVVTAAPDGAPVMVRNLGAVALAPMVRQGAVTRDGRGEVVTGVVMMLMGENPRVVARRVDEELARIAATLPPGIEIDTYYDRNDLVGRTIATVQRNLVEGGLLVVAVLLLFLGNVRGGLIVASAIPLSMLFAFTGMVRAGISGNLMSLGAIDFGLIVDGSVVMIENIVRRLGQAPEGRDRREVIAGAAREVARPVFFAVLIITIVYLPILTLQGVEGKMFRPMALTVVFALLASLVLALTLMPVLASLAFRRRVVSREPRVVSWLTRRYRPLLAGAIARPGVTGLTAAVLFAGSLLLVPSHVLDLQQEGLPVEEAVRQGAERRMRPVLMTALVASLGFVPMALATSPGAEVQRPLATVVIGGLVTSTLLTLFVLPSLYRLSARPRPGARPRPARPHPAPPLAPAAPAAPLVSRLCVPTDRLVRGWRATRRATPSFDFRRLADPSEGHMDEAQVVRDRAAAERRRTWTLSRSPSGAGSTW